MPRVPRTSPSSDAGFTLVEMLVALFAFAILSAASVAVMGGAFRAKETLETSLSEIERIALFDTLLREDFRNVTLRPTRDPFGTPEQLGFQIYPPDGSLVLLTRGGRSNPEGLQARGDLLRVAYALEDGALIRRTPRLPTPAPDTPVAERLLLEGIRDIDLTAFKGEQPLLQVAVRPGSEADALPDRVEWRIALDDGRSLRHVVEVGP